ncbi:MAG: lysophospholipid acyltransferase family protein [Thermoleophilaceae bacterium]
MSDERAGAGDGPLPLRPVVSFLRALRGGLDGGAGLTGALGDAALAMPREARESLEAAVRRLGGHYEEDDWGYDEGFADIALPFLEFMYDRWWRVHADGVANVPAHGRALLVANHAGIMPWDATMMGVALMRDHPLPRPPRFLVLDWAFGLPYISVAMRKLGGVPASPFNAVRLLEDDELVAVFPEGVKGAGKSFRDRYRVQRFGRGGFVEIALRTGAPIVPVAVVGSEEIHPKVGESALLARLTGAPYFPITPTFPLLGPLGVVPLPSRWRLEFGEPVDLSELGPEAANDRGLVLELSDHVHDLIQRMVYDNLVKRRNAFV